MMFFAGLFFPIPVMPRSCATSATPPRSAPRCRRCRTPGWATGRTRSSYHHGGLRWWCSAWPRLDCSAGSRRCGRGGCRRVSRDAEPAMSKPVSHPVSSCGRRLRPADRPAVRAAGRSGRADRGHQADPAAPCSLTWACARWPRRGCCGCSRCTRPGGSGRADGGVLRRADRDPGRAGGAGSLVRVLHAPPGYFYAFELLRWPWRLAGVAAVAVLAGTAQSYGVHKDDPRGVIVYAGGRGRQRGARSAGGLDRLARRPAERTARPGHGRAERGQPQAGGHAGRERGPARAAADPGQGGRHAGRAAADGAGDPRHPGPGPDRDHHPAPGGRAGRPGRPSAAATSRPRSGWPGRA